MKHRQVYVCSFLNLTIFLGQFLIGTAALTSHPRTIHSTAYEDVHLGNKLAEGVTTSYELPSKTKCADACNRHLYCRSFNFCGANICELNVEDIYSIQDGENQLTMDATCIYFGIRKEAFPVCENNGVFMSILKSTDRGRCEIFRRRVDREWGPWETSSSTSTWATHSEWKVVKKREVSLDAAHGGKLGSAETEQTVSWLRFVFEEKIWVDARDYCAQVEGRLFDALNGTSRQLEFLTSKVLSHYQYYFLGVSRNPDNRQVWLNMNGELMGNGKLLWSTNEPNGFNVNENYVALQTSVNALVDIDGSSLLPFICDLN